MNATFADTFYYIALLNPDDAAHEAAVNASTEQSGKIVTTEWVLCEVADAFSKPVHRPKFLSLMKSFEGQPDVLIVPSTSLLFRQGIELYTNRPDKDWPLTDCLSFVVMKEHGIHNALTGDAHFRQAGFVPLL